MFKILFKKEIVSLLCSVYSFVFASMFLFINGVLLWYLNGSYNIFDNGYATLEKFFTLSSMLFVLFIPALTMRSFSEEILTGTLKLQFSRPITITTIYWSKCIAVLVYILLIVFSTSIYIYILYPLGNLDIGAVILSYIGLCFVALVFVCWGVLASSISKYSVLGFIIGLLFNFVLFYSFDLLASVSSNVGIQSLLKQLSLGYHFTDIQRGILSIKDISIIISYILLAWIAIMFRFHTNRSIKYPKIIVVFAILVLVNLISSFISFKQFDFTKDKRYTLDINTKEILSQLSTKDDQLEVNVYLSDNINYSFKRLNDAVSNLIADFNRETDVHIKLNSPDVSAIGISVKDLPYYMARKNMPPITLNEKDRDGKITQQLIYPYAELIYESDTLQVSLLKQIEGYTAEENMNSSIANLEFSFIDAINLLINNEEKHIAFIEGHGELDRPYLYDAEEALAKYYFVNRGEIGNDVSVLDDFKVIIIAGSKDRFTEQEKYILDQYIMKGGRVLWLIDGAYVSESELAQNGRSAAVKNRANLDDLLFTYGVRINPDLLQDRQCLDVLLNNGANSQTVTAPWLYAPILIPSQENPITDNIAGVKASFASSLDLLRTNDEIKREVLLTTSQATRKIELPNVVDFDFQKAQQSESWFNDSFIPVAISLEGQFKSAFANRPIPDSLFSTQTHHNMEKSVETKMIVVSTSDIIKNELIGVGEQTTILPMGYDRLSKRTFGNKDFIVNAINWLAADDNRLYLRTKKFDLDILDKSSIEKNRSTYAVLASVTPILFVWIVLFVVTIYRKFKYTK